MSTARFLLLLVTTILIGCDQSQDRNEPVVKLSQDTLAPFEEALRQFDRGQAGFPPLPTNGTLKIETVNRENWNREYPPPRYDVMLHFVEDPPGFQYSYCTVAFKKTGDRLAWIGEQHSFHGPRQYEADGVMVPEALTLTRETEQIAFVGTNVTGTIVRYSGPVSRDLAVTDIVSILAEWSYFHGNTNAQHPLSPRRQ
jgi:hypothetical protein